MVISEALPVVALAVVSVAVALLVTGLLARRRAGVPSLSWLALALVLAVLVFTLGMVGISSVAAFFADPGSL